MKAGLARVWASVAAVAREAKVRKRLLAILAVILFLQLYFVRELVAAELLFGVGFCVLLAVMGVFYLLGAMGERGFSFMETGIRGTMSLVRRGYGWLEEVSKKPSRRPRSESAR